MAVSYKKLWKLLLCSKTAEQKSMVKMNGFAAIDFRSSFRFGADKAAIAADFHLGNGTCYYGKDE